MVLDFVFPIQTFEYTAADIPEQQLAWYTTKAMGKRLKSTASTFKEQSLSHVSCPVIKTSHACSSMSIIEGDLKKIIFGNKEFFKEATIKSEEKLSNTVFNGIICIYVSFIQIGMGTLKIIFGTLKCLIWTLVVFIVATSQKPFDKE